MTDVSSFSSSAGVNPPASGSELTAVNSWNESSTGSGAVVNPEATNRGVDNSGTGGTALTVDRNAVRDYLTEMYEGVPGLLQVWTVPAKGSGKFFATDEDGIEQAVDHISLQGSVGGQQSIYARVTTLSTEPEKHKRGPVSLSSHFIGLWTDLDFGMVGHAAGDKLPPDEEAAQAVYDASGLPQASITVNSGGGLYHLVLLDEPLDITDSGVRQRVGALSRRWQAQVKITAEAMGYAYGTGVSDLARVLRVPGTVNAKKWEHQRRAVHASTGLRYSLEDLETACPVPVVPEGGAGAGGGSGDWEAVPATDARDRMAQLIAEMRSCHWERNNALNRLAFMAYQLAGAGQLDPEDVRREFTDAGLSVGLEAPEVEATVRSASKGMQSPYVWTVRSRARQVAEQVDMWAGQSDETEQVIVPEPGEAGGDAKAESEAPGQIPEVFWASRSILRHIRQAAHARCASGDVALYGTFARLSGMLDHRLVADVGQGYASLNLFVGVVDDSGGGKSDGVAASEDLLMAPPASRDFLDGVGLSTGEGVTESFLGQVGTGEYHEKGPHKGEEKTVRGQVRHNAFFEVDEGASLISQGAKSNSILWPIIRSAWQAKTLSQQNATEDRRRFVGRNTYAMGILAAFQGPNALEVIRDDVTGSAQRFIWCRGSDPAVPRRRSQAPAHPGPLSVFPQLMEIPEGDWRVITFPDDIADRIWEEKAARKAGELVIDKLDSHANLMKMKLAALLALLNPELNPVAPRVSHEDWELAEMLWAANCELRTDLLRRAAVAEKAEAEQRRQEKVSTETAVHVSKNEVDTKIKSVARWMYNTVRDGKAERWGELTQRAPGRNSKYLRSAFAYAEANGWLVAVEAEDGGAMFITLGDIKA